MSDEDLDLEVRKITLQLKQLKVEQERLERQLNRVQSKIRRRDCGSAEGKTQGANNASPRNNKIADSVVSKPTEENNKREHDHRNKRNLYYLKRTDFRVLEYPYTKVVKPEIGDRVRILNPKKGQRDVGIVVAFCKDGRLKIRTDRDDMITRLPKNLNYFR